MESQPLNQSPISCIATLHNNPFLFAPLFEAFYKTLGDKDCSVLLSYLILPLVLPQASRKALLGTTALRTFTAKSERSYGLASRIAEWRRLTNLSVQHNIDQGVIELSASSAFVFKKSSQSQGYCPIDMIKAATKFAIICAPHGIPTIYLQLGIKRL